MDSLSPCPKPVPKHTRIGQVLLLCFLVASAAGQTRQLDSLKQVLPSLSGKERLSVLYALSNQLENTIPREARAYGLEGVQLAIQFGDSASLATLYSSLAFSSTELGEFDEALQYAYHSLEIATAIGNKRKIASANSTLGIAYVYIGLYSKALEHHLEALRLREELGLTVSCATTLNNIGIVYHNIGQYDKAIEYYKRAQERYGSNLPELVRVRYMANIGFAEFKRGNLEIALRYHQEGLAIAERSRFTSILAYLYFHLGIIASEQHESAKALAYLHRSLTNYDSLGQKYGVLQAENAIAANYFAMGRYAEARQHLRKAVELARRLKARGELKTAYETLYSIYDKTGPLAKAYEYYRLCSEMKDSLMNTRETKRFAEITIAHVTLEKEREIELLKKERTIAALSLEKETIQSYVLFFGTVSLIALSIFLYFTKRSIQRSNHTIERKNEELGVLNDELQTKISEVKLLTGLLPICANCKRIRDDNGQWEGIDQYISQHSDTKFSHGICPECMQALYGDYLQKSKPR